MGNEEEPGDERVGRQGGGSEEETVLKNNYLIAIVVLFGHAFATPK